MRVYMAEDDRNVGRVIRRMLDGCGVSVVPFVLPQEPDLIASMVSEAIRANPPALVVTDGLDGEAHRVILACRDRAVPCIVYTGEPRRFANAGVVVIDKPELRDLKRAVLDVVAHRGENG